MNIGMTNILHKYIWFFTSWNLAPSPLPSFIWNNTHHDLTNGEKEVKIYIWIENNSLSALGIVQNETLSIKNARDDAFTILLQSPGIHICSLAAVSSKLLMTGVHKGWCKWIIWTDHYQLTMVVIVVWWYKIHFRKLSKPACWEEHNMWQELVTLSRQTTEISCPSSLRFVVPIYIYIWSNNYANFFL